MENQQVQVESLIRVFERIGRAFRAFGAALAEDPPNTIVPRYDAIEEPADMALSVAILVVSAGALLTFALR